MVAEHTVSHSDPIAPVIFGVTLILIAALIGRYGARRLNQPSVLGELIMGVLVGNGLYFFGYELMIVLREGTAVLDVARLALTGIGIEEAAGMVLGAEASTGFLHAVQSVQGGEYLQVAQAVDIFSRYGVIFLLFHVGLDTCVAELKHAGADAMRVAIIGVVAPVVLGFLVSWFVVSEGSYIHHMFLGAALCATSIGVTARVLNDLNRNRSEEAHVILGAAVLDDVLGLIILAIVSGIIATGSLDATSVMRTVLLAVMFITCVLVLSPYVIRALTFLLQSLDATEAKLFVSFIFVMTLAWFANLIGLATIVGAFAAGLMLLDSHFQRWGDHHQHRYSIKELFVPIEVILVPIFFVLMGVQVKLEAFADWKVLLLALLLIVVASLGKVVAALGVRGPLNRLAIGIGMMPRGEVGLVFASIGKSLGVLDSAMFSAVVLMVIVTTLATPPLLKATMGTGPNAEGDRETAT